MYKELVVECSEGMARVQIQEPATLSEIQEAEKVVGYNFPDELKELLLEMNGDRWLLFSTDQIIERVSLNREYLLECYEDIEQHIFFAGNGCGDYYCYNVSPDGAVDTSAIHIWLHEDNETRMVAKDMEELIRRYYNSEI